MSAGRASRRFVFWRRQRLGGSGSTELAEVLPLVPNGERTGVVKRASSPVDVQCAGENARTTIFSPHNCLNVRTSTIPFEFEDEYEFDD